MSRSSAAAALHPPLAQRWARQGVVDFTAATPVSDGRTLVLQDTHALIGLDLADGALRWRHAVESVELAPIAGGFAYVAHGAQSEEIVAADWAGKELWRMDGGPSMGLGSLRGDGDTLCALGLERVGDPQLCRVLDAATGAERTRFDCPGDAPQRVARGWLYTVRALNHPGAGLYLVDAGTFETIQLLPDSHTARAVAGAVAVVDTFDTGRTASRLIAVDTDGGYVLWDADGGPNLTLAANGTQLLATTFAGEGNIRAVLRDLVGGSVLWQSDLLAGATAAVALAADVAVVTVPLQAIYLLDRATGALRQTLDDASTLTCGPCLLPGALADVTLADVRVWEHSA